MNDVKCEPIEYRCFHCGGLLVWDDDKDYLTYDIPGEGIVHELHCTDCGNITLCFVDDGEEDE